VKELDVRRAGEDFHRHVQRAVDARGAVVDLAWPPPRVFDEVLDRFPRRVGAHPRAPSESAEISAIGTSWLISYAGLRSNSLSAGGMIEIEDRAIMMV